MRTNGSILVKDLQKMLGLQIWIGTVFRVMRQFLTSTCDVLRVAQHKSHFFPRKHRDLVPRVLFDLKHWRRFIMKAPSAKFAYVLGRLPVTQSVMFSDASTSFGMAGVILFQSGAIHQRDHSGLFWQMSWDEWNKVASIAALHPRHMKINMAEFVAALITCETFSPSCVGKITLLHLDNITAKAWLDSARCPRAPFDRCAQGTHLYMIKMSMKIRTQWVPSSENMLADVCSRRPFSGKDSVHMVAGVTLLKVRPKWHSIVKFL